MQKNDIIEEFLFVILCASLDSCKLNSFVYFCCSFANVSFES